jgi:hypothetical protein
MANRYWVGTSALNRSGTWNTTTTSVWSTSRTYWEIVALTQG